MINLYIIDFYNLSKNNGLNTYLHQLSERLMLIKKLKVHFVWVYNTGCKDFEKEIREGIVHYYFPRHIAMLGDKTNFDVKAAEYLATEMVGQENIIVHFNWINHAPFAYLLKNNVNCKTVLTKHCVPWKNLITTNHSNMA